MPRPLMDRPSPWLASGLIMATTLETVSASAATVDRRGPRPPGCPRASRSPPATDTGWTATLATSLVAHSPLMTAPSPPRCTSATSSSAAPPMATRSISLPTLRWLWMATLVSSRRLPTVAPSSRCSSTLLETTTSTRSGAPLPPSAGLWPLARTLLFLLLGSSIPPMASTPWRPSSTLRTCRSTPLTSATPRLASPVVLSSPLVPSSTLLSCRRQTARPGLSSRATS
mmetsp:Transcript_104788/g.146065  ORF Transcript_104788/g.146065 Transcript_104788/m.146065 type:complete len:228 (-) Transcript_104788:173-856(-)